MKTKIAMTMFWLTYKLIVLLVTTAVSAADLPNDVDTDQLTLAVDQVDEQASVMSVAKAYLGTTKIWKWTQDAEHHEAIVRVTENRASGTGVYFTTGKIAGVLTAFHVVDGKGPYQIHWPDGRVDVSTTRIASRENDDLAIILLPKLRTDVNPVPITERDTYTGERLEMAGYGGPGRKPGEHTLRHFEVYQAKSKPSKDSANPGAMHGDSGGPIFSFQDGKPYIASVVSSGTTSTNKKQSISGGTASWYDDVHYPSTNRLVGFVAGVERSLTSDDLEERESSTKLFGGRQQQPKALPKACPPSGCSPEQGDSGAKIIRSRPHEQPKILPRSCPPGGCPPDKGEGGGGGDYELYPPEGFGENKVLGPNDGQGSGAVGLLLIFLAMGGAFAFAFHKRAFSD